MDYWLDSSADFPELRAPRYFLDLDSPPKSDWTKSTITQPYQYSNYYSNNILKFSHFPDLQTAATRPMTDTLGSNNNEPYPYSYHYADDILSFVEFSDGSLQVPVAYHFDITNIRLYFVELENGSVVTVTKARPGSCVTSGDDYLVTDSYRLVYEWNGGDVARVLQYDVSNSNAAEPEKKKIEPESTGKGDKQAVEASEEPSSSGSAIFCMDRLREELSCAICLEICFEPTTTPCGHSFCNECVRSAADICGNRCPKCRKFISKKRSGTVNTVLWNTIQLLFPKEVEGRNAGGDLTGRETQLRSTVRFASDSSPARFASDSSPVIFASDSSTVRFASDSSPARFPSDSSISRSSTYRVQAFHSQDSRSQSPERTNSHYMTGQSVRTYGMSSRGGHISSRTRREFHYPPITPDSRSQSPPRRNSHYMTGQSVRTYGMSSRGGDSSSRARREFHYPPIHDEDEDEDEDEDDDAALALRLQREEYMESLGWRLSDE